MNEPTNKEGKDACGHTGGCCFGKKFIVGILLALLLFGLGFCLGKSNLCAMPMCPISQQK